MRTIKIDTVETIEKELWTAKQRQSHSLHEISYRACYKAELPRYFIEKFTSKGDLVFDPFMGRGTTVLEASLLGRRGVGNDSNPLSVVLLKPRLNPPKLWDIKRYLFFLETGFKKTSITETVDGNSKVDLSMFYHPETRRQIEFLKQVLSAASSTNKEHDIKDWIRMVATNRLTGHSIGFFSVYSLPPNQATLQSEQK